MHPRLPEKTAAMLGAVRPKNGTTRAAGGGSAFGAYGDHLATYVAALDAAARCDEDDPPY